MSDDSLDEDDWVVAAGILSSSEEATALVPHQPEQRGGPLSSSSGAGALLPPPAQATTDVGQGAADSSSPISMQTPLSKVRVIDLVRHHHDTMLQRPELLSDCDMGLGLVLSILLLKYHDQNLDDDLGPLLPEQTTYRQLRPLLLVSPLGFVLHV